MEQEGRHLAGTDSADKIDSAQRTYRGTEKGKKAIKKHAESQSRKDSVKKYSGSEKQKLSRKLYYESPLGQEAVERQKDRQRLLRAIRRFLKSNPDKTVDDYFKEVPNERPGTIQEIPQGSSEGGKQGI